MMIRDKVFSAVEGLLDGKRVAVICRTHLDVERFFGEVMTLVGRFDGIGVTGRGREAVIRLGDGCILITSIQPPGVSADVAILDEHATSADELCYARMCVLPRGGRVIE